MSKRILPTLPAPSDLANVISASPAAVLEPPPGMESSQAPVRKPRATSHATTGKRFSALPYDEHTFNHQAELFYLQKQTQQQTPMVFVLEDGARIQGVVEWYDRNSIKVRGKSRVLVYKSAIKYLYKAGEVGTAPGL